MKFSVLIPTYNRCDLLSRTLSALFVQEFPANEFEVIVVVDGSNDGTLAMLQSLRPRCGFQFFYQSNRGLPAARNAALKAAKGELILILDDDIVCESSLLRKHFEQHLTANLVVFGPVPLHPDSPPGLVAEQWAMWNKQFLDRLERENGCGPPTTLWLAASAPAVNRSIARTVLETYGFCDEKMKDCHEDWELGIRLWKAGVRFHFQPDAIAYHLYTKSDRDLVEKEAPLVAKGEVALSRKHSEYRPLSMLAGMGSGRLLQRMFAAVAASLPFSLEPLLRPLFLVLNFLRRTPMFNSAGARLLGYRNSLMIYGEAARITGSRKALKAEFGMRLPVLAYHHVGTSKASTYPDLSLSAHRFERHIRWLHRMGYRSISPADWLRWCRDGTGLPQKPVLLTFDDAFADIAEFALPVLQRHGFGATVFVVTGHIGGTNAWDEARGSAIHPLMTAEQLRYWADQGIEFGAHSRTHPDLASASASEVAEELVGSRDELSAILGRKVTLFAYPYGRYNEAASDAVRKTFELAFTTDEGLNNLNTDPFLMKRNCIGHRDSVADLQCLLRWGLRPFSHLRAKVRVGQRLTRAASWLVYSGLAER
jgi:peptidoglycan/xylan/chitin deacetylase (PgdA/CDA1 family)/glycosyltransferase involved in cell wall biosynthesis